MKKVIDGLKKAWKRLTSSKVAWMALPAGLAQVWLALVGDDVSVEVNAIFSAAWTVLALFLSANNPTDRENF